MNVALRKGPLTHSDLTALLELLSFPTQVFVVALSLLLGATAAVGQVNLLPAPYAGQLSIGMVVGQRTVFIASETTCQPNPCPTPVWKWSSTSPSVASVPAFNIGYIDAKAVGTTTIIATDETTGHSGSEEISVSADQWFLSGDPQEVANVTATGFINDGIVFNWFGSPNYSYGSPDPSLVPLWRFLDLTTGTHFWTTDPNGEQFPQTGNVRREGTVGYVSQQAGDAGAIPVYRFFSPSTGVHHWSTSSTTPAPGFNLEGVVYYALPVGTSYFSALPVTQLRCGFCFQLGVAPALPPGQAGMRYPMGGQSAQLVSGGTPPYDASSLVGPQSVLAQLGLVFDPATGLVSGTLPPDVWGNYPISTIVGDSAAPPGLVTGSATLTVVCGNPLASPPGDNRDILLGQYAHSPFPGNGPVLAIPGQPFNPNCTFVTQSVIPEFNIGTYQSYPDAWMVFDALPGFVTAWQQNLARLDAVGPTPIPVRTLKSGYRTPINQSLCCRVTRSQHMFGKAVDINTVSLTNVADYLTVIDAAQIAALESGTPVWMEDWNGVNECEPGFVKCVHADVRYVAGEYYTP